MGNPASNIRRFRERITRERKRRGWSQTEVAKMLTARGIDSIYNTTVAKLENGDREIKLDEAMALADLYEIPLDTLLGRKQRGQGFAPSALLDAAFTSRTELQRISRSLGDLLEDIPSDFDQLAGYVRDAFDHLDQAGGALDDLVEHILMYLKPQTYKELTEGQAGQ